MENTPGQNTTPAATAPLKFEKVRQLTFPLLSLKTEGQIVHVAFLGPIFLGKKLKGDQTTKEPAHLCMVADLDNGAEVKQMIMPSVLRSTLEEEYPDAGDGKGFGYVRRCFEIENLGKKKGAGKSAEGYNTFRLVEVRVPGLALPSGDGMNLGGGDATPAPADTGAKKK